LFNIFKKPVLSLSKRTRQSMERTRELWWEKIGGIFGRSLINDDLWNDLEEVLIAGDVGVSTSMRLIEGVKARVKNERVREGARVQALLGEEMVSILKLTPEPPTLNLEPLSVILVVGVNGTGKTTSIAKLAYAFKGQEKKVMLAAADTFRAGAIDQLKHWGERLGVEVISSQPGGDPGAVVFDALEAARRRKADVLIADTAGRIQTKFNLMEELKKIRRIITRAEIDPVVLLVLDANTGQNGLSQARYFSEALRSLESRVKSREPGGEGDSGLWTLDSKPGVDGIILTKLDSTSRGGIVLAIVDQLKIPILFIGTGQEMDDLAPFKADEFVESLLNVQHSPHH